MSADDRIEMDEEMAEFWAEVKDRLPGLLGRDGFVSAYPLADYLLLEEVPFTVAVFPALGMSNINLLERVIKIRTGRGTAKVALSTLEGTNLGDVDITIGSRGVSYPFCTMQSLIHAAVSGGREGGDGA